LHLPVIKSILFDTDFFSTKTTSHENNIACSLPAGIHQHWL
jgi:hypothetical protein